MTAKTSHKQPRILLLSLRQAQNFIFNSCLYEFEDLVCQFDEVELLLAPPQNMLLTKLITKTTQTITKNTRLGTLINPYHQSISLEQEYDLFFVIIDFPWNYYTLKFVNNWQKKCRKAVCYISEVWHNEIQKRQFALEFFRNFDHIFLGLNHSLEAVANITKCPCSYLPHGVDTLKFYPHTAYSQRSIDLCNLGRRSPITHKALLELAEKQDFFYWYEPLSKIKELRFNYPKEHRTLIANLLKNSRYFIANYAKIDLTERTKKHQEIATRFFEGAAAGTVMLGCPPNTKIFKQYFDWSNAVIPLPFDTTQIKDTIAQLDAQPELLAQISADNVANSLLKHDVVYRWQKILTTVGLKPTPAMVSRQAYLQKLADKTAVSVLDTIAVQETSNLNYC